MFMVTTTTTTTTKIIAIIINYCTTNRQNELSVVT